MGTHRLLPLVFLIVALQGSHTLCEGGHVRDLNSYTSAGSQGGGRLCADDATDQAAEVRSILDDASVVRPLLQSIVNLLNFWATGAKNLEELEFGDEIKLEARTEEKSFNTSGARFVYNAENLEEEQENDEDESRLRLPSEQQSNPTACSRTGNYIDDCWRCDSNWHERRQQLASCGLGFGRNALGGGGRNGELYVVTTNQDDTQNPAAGTLRYGVTRKEPLWITFASSMTIQLKGQLEMTSHKTIDGRGAEVHIVGSSQITIEGMSNVIIHGIYVHDIVQVKGKFEGDAIRIKNSRDVWIDRCYLANAYDGLIDITKNSTAVTVSNCLFENQDKVMLFGASVNDAVDRNMQVTVAFNRFGPNLKQRMPRCRYGNCHVANNFYTDGWGLYAIGGSEHPTILSQANRFVAPNASNRKEVTRRIDDGGPTFGGWETWDWTSSGDSYANGAFFKGSGVQDPNASNYDRARSFVPRHATWVQAMTKDAGPLKCVPRTAC